MDLIAFALTADYEGTVTIELEDGSTEDVPKFGGGLLASSVGDIDVGKLLEEGDGAIVLDASAHGPAVELLRHYPALEEVDVPSGAKAIALEEPEAGYGANFVPQLREIAADRGIDGAAGAKKGDLVAALEEYDRRAAAGELELPVTVDELAAAAAAREEA